MRNNLLVVGGRKPDVAIANPKTQETRSDTSIWEKRVTIYKNHGMAVSAKRSELLSATGDGSALDAFRGRAGLT
jgi:hypothetical protein